ncbi:pyridoxine kinase [Melghirimyces profundicolus]|uniref:pyridoxal kinase n=1 Tax=Melghirimyces profundicolus TaxID=1242148 RepID=A0A2T6BW81_9BACL|nr:pyridoxine/pyridoxal/pyridoxamine kinase [Melghirimyces profundicolus]PTX60323.1 pyridoxine kinase [Melghirimyces profundicolus]
MKKALTLAGSDTSGGAGIQADLKTFQALDVYGMSALNTIVTMDPENGWAHGVHPIPLETVKAQLETILSTGIDAMKTGMLSTAEIIGTAADLMDRYEIHHAVVDPVMVCKGENDVLHPENKEALRDRLVSKATIVTPNLFEASQLAGTEPITTLEEMKAAARAIHRLGPKYVLIKGGSGLSHERAVDLLYDGERFTTYESEKLDTPHTHGAGCTYSAAITAGLAHGKSVEESVRMAKNFITEAIRNGFPLNQYVGPVRQMKANFKG